MKNREISRSFWMRWKCDCTKRLIAGKQGWKVVTKGTRASRVCFEALMGLRGMFLFLERALLKASIRLAGM